MKLRPILNTVTQKIQSKPKKVKKFRRQINKSRLPHPVTFYRQFDITLKAGTVWQKVKCPFHNDTNPSLSINPAIGIYCCHACGEKGDMLKFYMTYHHVDFLTACEQLDLFEGDF